MGIFSATVLAAALLAADGLVVLGASTPSEGPVVDLGYARYRGYLNESTGLNVWKR